MGIYAIPANKAAAWVAAESVGVVPIHRALPAYGAVTPMQKNSSCVASIELDRSMVIFFPVGSSAAWIATLDTIAMIILLQYMDKFYYKIRISSFHLPLPKALILSYFHLQ
jgi:hypothetical protein